MIFHLKNKNSPYSSKRHYVLEESLCRTNEVRNSTTHRLPWNNLDDSLREIHDSDEFTKSLRLYAYTYK